MIRGNLLVIPIGNSLLYVEPLYLQAQNGKIPELKRVVLASADRVVMAENLGLALIKMFGRDTVSRAGLQDLADVVLAGEPSAASGATDTIGGPGATGGLQDASIEDLVLAANTHYNNAQAQLRAGNWAGYGEEMQALQAVIQQMAAAMGVQAELPAPAAGDTITPTAPAGEPQESAP